MTELLPCPFCGGEAQVVEGYGYWHARCTQCPADYMGCHRDGIRYETMSKKQVIAAWNTRAERTCFADEVTHRDCKYSVNRGWRELTCHIVDRQEEPQYGVLVRDYTFSCGHCICWAHTYEPRYCPNCGAKVVEQ